jgi:hypothetical protein
MFSTPLIASSSGTITLFWNVSALAPGYDADTKIVGGAMFGYRSIGNDANPMIPPITTIIDITVESTGRSINVLIFIL